VEEGFDMRSFLKAMLYVVVGSTALVGSSVPSVSGNVFQDVWGVITDPLKLRASSSELSASVERALLQLNQLEGRADYDIKARLEQIRSILREALDGGEAALKNALDRMTALEKQINEDAFALIARAECAVENVNARLQVALSDIMKQLIKADPRIEIAGLKASEFIVNPVPIQDANEAYKDARTKAFTALDKDHFTDQSEAGYIFWTYQNLKVLAKWTRCRYDGAGTIFFTREMNELERLSLPWTTVVNMRPF
jgi:hypothetical protein